jgi:glutamate N-acetyltransferase/amino-acid N-acetyltransferase
METVSAGIDAAAAALSDDGGAAAAQAILTTDLVPKTCAVQLESNGAAIAIGGIAKGSGMIGPQLVTAKPHATMLAYLTTDAAVDVTFLRACLDRAVGVSFNAISVDGDTSTNDTVVILANGAAGGAPIVEGTDAAAAFEAAVTEICIELAKAIVRDGEGATRLIEIAVTGAMNDDEARRCAGVIANSALCKTAWFGGDPNWGRIVAAAGRAGVELKPEAVQLRFGDLVVVDGGAPLPLEEPVLAAAVAGKEITLTLDLGVGDGKAQMWSCDLSYDYVKINAEYHT